MKDSEVEWIGKVPDTWKLIRLKDYFDFEKGKNAQQYTQEYIGENEGVYPVYSGQTENDGIMGRIKTYDYDIDKCIFTTTVGAKVMTVKLLEGKFSLSQNCLIMKKIKKCNEKFIYYLLQPLFENEKNKIPSYMQPSLRMEDLNSYSFYIPKIEEQVLIANLLDNKIEKIDYIITALSKEIKILEKYKKSLITETVTKGLNTNVSMKDSGIDWIGSIPEHWNISKVKYNVVICNGKEIETEEGEVPVYGTGGAFKTTNKFLYKGESVLLGRKGTIDKPLLVDDEFWTVDTAFYTIMKDKILTKMFYYLAICFDYKYYQTGSAVPSMTQTDLGSIYIPLGTKGEQNEIINYLDKKCFQINEIIKDKQIQIDKMEKYKKSLIYEYVTGKKRVRGAEELYV